MHKHTDLVIAVKKIVQKVSKNLLLCLRKDKAQTKVVNRTTNFTNAHKAFKLVSFPAKQMRNFFSHVITSSEKAMTTAQQKSYKIKILL